MKTETKLIYASYCEITSWTVHSLFDTNMKEYLEKSDKYHYLCEVVIPVVSNELRVEMGINAYDKDIAKHSAAIAKLEAKKQQLLCIEHVVE